MLVASSLGTQNTRERPAMKEIVSVMAALTMCLTLTACGGSNDAAEGEAQGAVEVEVSSDDPEAIEEANAMAAGPIDWYEVDWDAIDWKGADAVGQIAFGIDFMIYGTADGQIIAVEGLDDTAQAICNSIDVAGKAYDEVLTILLDEGLANGAIEERDAITVEFVVNEVEPTYDWTETGRSTGDYWAFDNDIDWVSSSYGTMLAME